MCWVLSPGMLQAASFPEFVDPHPDGGNQFGATIVPLSTGNVVITSPLDDAGGTDAGAVYLFNGATGALISTLRGSSAFNQVGSGGVTALTNGNYVVQSPRWRSGGLVDVGAATWGNGTTGVSGVVSSANSLVGSTAGDQVGGLVTPLTNGNYVVRSPIWDNGAVANAGAVTWGNGTSGVSGVVSSANSLVGSAASDSVGGNGVTVLTNGNYVVRSMGWDNGATANVGAATWGNGASGVSGVVSSANSLIGSTANDRISSSGVTALTNGNYVVVSPLWDSPNPAADVGAVTWGSGTSGVRGTVTIGNSLVGTDGADLVGNGGVTALTNGNYVVASANCDNVSVNSAGAATWGNGTGGTTGGVNVGNSLMGSTANDNVGGSSFTGSGGVTALSNGNYVVGSPQWSNGGLTSLGAATWGSGASGVTGTVSGANSLIGPQAGDQVGTYITALSNGNYVVVSPSWHNGAVINAGAATWGNGTSGVTGTVSAANSLVGSTANDLVGRGNTNTSKVTALTNGNYVVGSPLWDSGGLVDVGAVTWGSGTSGVTGAVSAANSLVGSTASDQVGVTGVTALTNGNYVVTSHLWDNGAIADVGAVTWGSGTSGVTGAVSAANSLIGSTLADEVGINGVTALTNGNYVVCSRFWDGAVSDVGAATWANGATGLTGTVSAANSLIGSTAGDLVGNAGATALANGNYVVRSPNWDNGSIVDAGALTWGSGTTGVTGTVSVANSFAGSMTGLPAPIEDPVNQTFIARFLMQSGPRVRVGPQGPPIPNAVSAVDIPNDQGGWLRLTFNRSLLDDADYVPPVATYGIWRKLPGSIPSNPARANPSAAREVPGNGLDIKRVRALLPIGFEVREVGGRIFVMGARSPSTEITAAFPPGTWEMVASVNALQQAQYLAAVPTISNAAPNDFVVTAHTTTPSVWFIGNVVSGQSMDNLAPAQPTAFTASYSSGQTNLQWAVNTEHDLGSYHLYRGTSADFTPSLGNLIASPTTTSYADVGPAGSYYKLSAVDVNSNESSFALVTPDATTDAGDEPVAFALAGARPNPAQGNRLQVAFALPTGAPARLELMDIGGRRLLSREVGSLGAGRHTVNLAQGHHVAAGIYWVQLAQGDQLQSVRVAVIR
jgi:hypothetical protein